MNLSRPPSDVAHETIAQQHHAQNIADPDVRYYDLTLELAHERFNTERQREFYHARLQELEEQLNTVVRQRDEARQELSVLRQLLEKQTGIDENRQVGNSSSSPPMIDELNNWVFQPEQNLLEFPSNDCGASADELLNKQTFYPQHNNEVFIEQQNNGVFIDQPEPTDGKLPVETPLLQLVEDPITGHDVWQQEPNTSEAYGMPVTSPETGDQMGLYPPHLSSKPVHLPIPPEANMQVMLDTLPEKGKLLEAVMRAGPLLQTLLVAGPLPQWQHQPPWISQVEIPSLLMDSTPNVFQVDPSQPHMTAPQDLFRPPSYLYPPPGLVSCSRTPSDPQHPMIYQAGSSSSSQPILSSANFKPILTTLTPDSGVKFLPKVPKFRSTSKPFQDKNPCPDSQSMLK